jgi:hypothetical protein
MLSISFTNISLWENGHRVPNVETVAMILAAIRVSPEERERILDLARHVHEPNWIASGMEGVSQQLVGVIECERAASVITEWTPMHVPGLLQTPDYSRAIMEASGKPSQEVDLLVMVRSGRREVITRREPVRFDVLISEAALYEPVGSPGVMAHQLHHLVEMTKYSNVSVQIVPMRVGWHPGWSGPFVLYEFRDSGPVVYFEHHSSGTFIPAERDVNKYKKAIDTIRGLALSPAASTEFMAKVAQDMEGSP